MGALSSEGRIYCSEFLDVAIPGRSGSHSCKAATIGRVAVAIDGNVSCFSGGHGKPRAERYYETVDDCESRRPRRAHGLEPVLYLLLFPFGGCETSWRVLASAVARSFWCSCSGENLADSRRWRIAIACTGGRARGTRGSCCLVVEVGPQHLFGVLEQRHGSGVEVGMPRVVDVLGDGDGGASSSDACVSSSFARPCTQPLEHGSTDIRDDGAGIRGRGLVQKVDHCLRVNVDSATAPPAL